MELRNWHKRYIITPNRRCSIWYFGIYLQPKFEFKITITKWTVGIWIFGIGIAFEKLPF